MFVFRKKLVCSVFAYNIEEEICTNVEAGVIMKCYETCFPTKSIDLLILRVEEMNEGRKDGRL
jgi:hypothetical protein